MIHNKQINALYALQTILKQIMGSVCGEKMSKGEGLQSQPSRAMRKKGNKNTMREDAEEIKQFLTLTSQNTESCFSPEEQERVRRQSKDKTISDFKVERGLGRGAFGQVFLVRDTSPSSENLPRLFAMKIIRKESIQSTEDRISTLSERYILEKMNHPFLVRLHYAFQSASKLYLVCDLMVGGQLFYLLRKKKKFTELTAKFYASQIILALQYLHRRQIIYRDLKPQNILLDAQGHLKLTDFGMSKVCINETTTTYSICGTPQYIAPQVVLGKGYSQSADWFSFGSLLYDMLTGKPPFYSTNKEEILRKITSKAVPIPDFLSKDAKTLLRALFKINPKERLGHNKGAEEIKAHPFFNGIDFDKVLKKEVQPPISFRNDINEEGFEAQFQGNMLEKSKSGEKMANDTNFVGFTYVKQEPTSPLKFRKGSNEEDQLQEIILEEPLNSSMILKESEQLKY